MATKIKPQGIWVNGRWVPAIKGGQLIPTAAGAAGGAREQGK